MCQPAHCFSFRQPKHCLRAGYLSIASLDSQLEARGRRARRLKAGAARTMMWVAGTVRWRSGSAGMGSTARVSMSTWVCMTAGEGEWGTARASREGIRCSGKGDA